MQQTILSLYRPNDRHKIKRLINPNNWSYRREHEITTRRKKWEIILRWGEAGTGFKETMAVEEEEIKAAAAEEENDRQCARERGPKQSEASQSADVTNHRMLIILLLPVSGQRLRRGVEGIGRSSFEYLNTYFLRIRQLFHRSSFRYRDDYKSNYIYTYIYIFKVPFISFHEWKIYVYF